MDANERPPSPDWIREFQAPEVSNVLSSPSTSSGKSDPGEIKRTRTSRKSLAEDSDHSKPSPKTVARRAAAGGKAVKTPKANGKRKETDEDYVPSPKKSKRLANVSPEKVIVIDDDEGDVPIAGLEISSKTSRVSRKASTPKELVGRPARSLKQTDLKFLSNSGIESQEGEDSKAGEVVASHADETGIEHLGTQEVIEPQPDDQEDEEVPDLKIEQGAMENDVVGSQEPRAKAKVPSSLPLIFPEKVNANKVLIECGGDDLDLSGDMGAVGRFIVCGKDNDELVVDLKGVVYKAGMIPCATLMVVNIGQTEAKVEAIVNEFMQLTVDQNMHEDETLMEGTLDDFQFGSDIEGDGVGPTPPAPGQGQENDGKPKQKSNSSEGVQKAKRVTVKKGKVAIKVGKGGRVGKVGATRKSKATNKPSAKARTKKQARK